MAKVGDVIEADNAAWRFSGAASTHFDAHISDDLSGFWTCRYIDAKSDSRKDKPTQRK